MERIGQKPLGRFVLPPVQLEIAHTPCLSLILTADDISEAGWNLVFELSEDGKKSKHYDIKTLLLKRYTFATPLVDYCEERVIDPACKLPLTHLSQCSFLSLALRRPCGSVQEANRRASSTI
jgi:hypothetical protein